MARKKLYGAALAAYNKKRGNVALVRRGKATPAVVVTAAAPARRRRSSVRRYAGRAAGGIVGAIKAKLPGMAASAAYGYLTKPTSPFQGPGTGPGGTDSASIQQTFLRIPVLDTIGRKASHGLLFHAIGAYTGGMLGSVARHLGDAALYSYAFDFGRAEGSYEQAAVLSFGGHLDDGEGYED